MINIILKNDILNMLKLQHNKLQRNISGRIS